MDEMKNLKDSAQSSMMTIYVISMGLMAAVCICACICIAHQSVATAEAYFGYQAEPLNITNTQNNE